MITFAPDVSKYDAVLKTGALAPLDWYKAREVDKISIAIIKSSEYDTDPAFKMQWAAAKGLLPRMAYHYFRPQRSDQFETFFKAVPPSDFADNDLIALDWEYSYLLMTKQAQRDRAYDMLCKLRLYYDTTPYVYSYPAFIRSMGIDLDPRFAQFGLWLAQWPYDTSTAPIWNAASMDNFKARIIAGAMKPVTVAPWNRPPDIWQFTSRCAPAYLACYPVNAAKKAVDFNAVYVDVGQPVPPVPPPAPLYPQYRIVKVGICANVRSGPGATYPIIGTIPLGAVVSVDTIDQYHGYSHYRDWTGEPGAGWVASQFMELKA